MVILPRNSAFILTVVKDHLKFQMILQATLRQLSSSALQKSLQDLRFSSRRSDCAELRPFSLLITPLLQRQPQQVVGSGA